MGVLSVMAMTRSHAKVGSIYKMAKGDAIGVDVSVWLYQLSCFISADAGDDVIVFVADCPLTSPAHLVFDVHGRLQDIVLRQLVEAGFQCVIAPAEADDQLALMCHLGQSQGVIATAGAGGDRTRLQEFVGGEAATAAHAKQPALRPGTLRVVLSAGGVGGRCARGCCGAYTMFTLASG
ncbi:hypothetical protein T492DRAFT_896243 [Pavlovales sp. CCMP2436]|nr:hypothetical protein T492DRAFT_896243 [Pavlovales sp. CCMP2436]